MHDFLTLFIESLQKSLNFETQFMSGQLKNHTLKGGTSHIANEWEYTSPRDKISGLRYQSKTVSNPK